MRAIEERARASKEQRQRTTSEKERTQKQEAADYRGLGVGMTVAYAIIGMPIFGWLIGLIIDSRLKTESWRTNLALIGVVAGIGFAFFVLQRQEK